MKFFSTLNKKQKEAAGILQIGTFLEYFDLMLYIHMAVLLNDLFFPKTNFFASKLLQSTTFCITFIFRPVGAILFGYIGDNFGRKPTVIITTIMMATTCFVMANLPTYAQIGITASVAMILCRIFQSISSVGEIVGAEIYLTELIKPPARYPIVCFMDCAYCVGAIAALGVVNAVFLLNLEWRFAFWIGTLIALIGSISRTALRETPDFLNSKKQLQKAIKEFNSPTSETQSKLILNEKVKPSTIVAYFLIQCGYPIFFYFTYIYCSNFLQQNFDYTAKQIIYHNLQVSIIEFIAIVTCACLSYTIHPLKIVRFRMLGFIATFLFIPVVLSLISKPHQMLLLQMFLCVFFPLNAPAEAVFFVHFPIFKRFTYAGFIYSLARAFIYTITAFGIIFLAEKFGHWGLLVVFIPVTIGFIYGLNHFQFLEKEAGSYH
jgi:MFS family permease